MANIRAFNGVLYNQDKVNINDVVSPPYDVIPQKFREELFKNSEYNVIRLILGIGTDWYSSAANYFNEWKKKEILIRDEKPTLYYLKQEFECEGKNYIRGGFISLCELIEFDKGVVLPHEKTLSGPKADRLELMKATNANFEQIYGLYYDPERNIEGYFKSALDKKPELTATIEGVKNILWKLTDPELIEKIIDEMKEKKIYIADGHHRYETGITYRNYRREKDPDYKGNQLYDYILMFLTNVEDPGLVILPTHRAIFGLNNIDFNKFKEEITKYFSWEEYSIRSEALQVLKKYDHHAFMFSLKGKKEYVVIKLKDKKMLDEMIAEEKSEYIKNLDVTILHSYILRKILGISQEAQVKKLNLEYEKDADTALELINEDKYQVVFILNPSKIDEVTSIANEGGTMPQKSTYFFPKMYSGILFSPFDENA